MAPKATKKNTRKSAKLQKKEGKLTEDSCSNSSKKVNKRAVKEAIKNSTEISEVDTAENETLIEHSEDNHMDSNRVTESSSSGKKEPNKNSEKTQGQPRMNVIFNEDNDQVKMSVDPLEDEFLSDDSSDDGSVKIAVSKKQLERWRKSLEADILSTREHLDKET